MILSPFKEEKTRKVETLSVFLLLVNVCNLEYKFFKASNENKLKGGTKMFVFRDIALILV